MQSMVTNMIRYGYLWPGTRALGPGYRFAIWLQGCNRRCYRCTSPDLQPIDGGQVADVDELVEQIVSDESIDGITVSGGEPLLQAAAVGCLLQEAKLRKPSLNVILFTGYLLEDLHSEETRKVLSCVDLLIDGEYIDSLNDNQGLRGSSNQRLHFLTSELLPWRDELLHGPRRRELHMIGEHEMLTIGIAPRRVAEDYN